MPATRNSGKSSSSATKSRSPHEPSPDAEGEGSSSTSPQPNASGNPPPPEKERSRNAKAQARHREKRKAYIEHLEKSVQQLKAQLQAMGISSPSPSILASPQDAAANEARLRALQEENERLKREIRGLRDRLDAMSRGGGPTGYIPHGVPTLPSLPMPDDTMLGGRRRSFDENHGPTYLPPPQPTESPYSLVPLSLSIPPSPPISNLPSHLQGPYTSHRHGTQYNNNSHHAEEPFHRTVRGPLSGSHLTQPQHRHSLPSVFSSTPYTPSPLRDSPAPTAPLPPGLGLQQQSSVRHEWPPLLQPPLTNGGANSSASSYTFSPSAPPSRTTSTSPPRTGSGPVSPAAVTSKKPSGGYDSFGWPPTDVQAEEHVA